MSRIAGAGTIATMLTVGAGLFTPVMAADAWIGNYSGSKGSYHWHATITNKSTSVYTLHTSVKSRMPLCSGDLDATARAMGDKLIVNDNDCSLTITKRGAAGIKIDEKECAMWHGAACIFDSELARQ